jgi:hypothetical protein
MDWHQATNSALRQALRSFSCRNSSGCSARRCSAVRSVTVTDPWVAAKQTVGQRVIPLVRMKSATAASYLVWDISHLLSILNAIKSRGVNDLQSPDPLKSGSLLKGNYVRSPG